MKLTLIALCAGVIPSALVVDRGPSHEMRQAWPLREKMKAVGKPTMLWGDGAFDSETWHVANLTGWGVPSQAPPTVRRKDGRVSGVLRTLCRRKLRDYGPRWMCESVNSAIKRTTGSSLRSRKENTLFAEAALKIAAYAVWR